MTGPKRVSIRFSCRNCTTRLAAPLRAAGKELRCPYCFTMLVVPKDSTPAKRGDDYALADATPATPGSATEPEYVTVVCPVCATRMYAGADRVGQTMTCPDCDSPVVVRRPEKPLEKETPRPATSEEYALYQGEGQPPPSSREVYQVYIPVVCPVCQTRMLATENEVGQELACPDCETRVRVPPLAIKAPVKEAWRSGKGREEAYDVNGARSGAAPPAPPRHVLVVCGVCHTRLHATVDQVGQEIVCPDCYTPLVVPAPQAEQDAPAETIEEYQVGAVSAEAPLPIYIPGFEPIVDQGPLRPKERPAREEPTRPAKRRPSPERKRRSRPPGLGSTFFSGVFNFPLYRDSWSHWVALSLGMLFVVAVAREAILIGEIKHPLTWFICAMVGAIAGLLVLVLLIRGSGAMLDVVRDTAAGSDEVEPSEELWIDRLLEFLFPMTAFGITVLLGIGFDRLLAVLGLTTLWGVPVAVFLLFPILLLSMLEIGTPLGVISPSVLQSLLVAWPAWLLFYVETFLLLTAVSGAGWLASLAHFWLGAVVSVVAGVWALMVYCRLLGRLARYCDQGE